MNRRGKVPELSQEDKDRRRLAVEWNRMLNEAGEKFKSGRESSIYKASPLYERVSVCVCVCCVGENRGSECETHTTHMPPTRL